MGRKPPPGPITTEIAITLLMSRPNLVNARIQPEQRICIDFADQMRRHTSQGRYKGIWGHIPNEGARSRILGALMRAMGLIPGSTDFYFMWNGGGCVIEFKTPARDGWNKQMQRVKLKAGKQSEYQGYFQKWCEYCQIPYFLCTGVEEAEERLRGLNGLNV